MYMCDHECDHECACEKSIYKRFRHVCTAQAQTSSITLLPSFLVLHVYSVALHAYVAYLAPDIDVVRPMVGELQFLEQPRQVLLAQHTLHHIIASLLRRPRFVPIGGGDPFVLQEYCFLDCEYGRQHHVLHTA